LLGIDDEARAIGGPWNSCFHAVSVLGSRLWVHHFRSSARQVRRFAGQPKNKFC
jgi:hypothetical protein